MHRKSGGCHSAQPFEKVKKKKNFVISIFHGWTHFTRHHLCLNDFKLKNSFYSLSRPNVHRFIILLYYFSIFCFNFLKKLKN